MAVLILPGRSMGGSVIEALGTVAERMGARVSVEAVNYCLSFGGNAGNQTLLYVTGRFGHALKPGRHYRSLRIKGAFGNGLLDLVNQPGQDNRTKEIYGLFSAGLIGRLASNAVGFP